MWIRVCRYKNAGVAGYAEALGLGNQIRRQVSGIVISKNDVLVRTFAAIKTAVGIWLICYLDYAINQGIRHPTDG